MNTVAALPHPARARTPLANHTSVEGAVASPQPRDGFSRAKDITVVQALKGLVGAAVGASIMAVGNTAASLVDEPRLLAQSYKTLFKSQMLGPVIKTSIALTLPVAALAAPPIVALGSAIYGMFRGCSSAVDGGLTQAIADSSQDVATFRREGLLGLSKALAEHETSELPEGQEPFDIHPVDAGKALAGGTLAGLIDGVGMGALTLVKTPRGVVRAFAEIWKSDQGPVLKTTGSLLVLPAAILATPLATLGGAFWGFGEGVAKGYQGGFGSAVKEAATNLRDYNESLDKLLREP